MPIYNYVAKTPENTSIKGSLVASTPRHARDLLRDKSLQVTALSEAGTQSQGTRATRPSQFFARRHTHSATSFFREISTLLAVGVPLSDGLDILHSQLRGHFRSIVMQVRESIASGSSLSVAMSQFPAVFDRFCISMASVGENSGQLDVSLAQLAQFREERHQMKDRALSALIYPGIVASVATGVTMFLMTVVVPTLLQNLEEMGRPLPMPTKILKFLSDSAIAYGFPFAIVLLVITGIAMALLATTSGKRYFSKCMLKTPLVGKLIQKQNCSRTALFVGTLTQSGIDPLRAFEIAADSIGNILYREALQGTAREVTRGKDFADALAPYASLFPPTVVQLFTLGQNSGQLDIMLLRLAKDLDRETATLANRISTLVEPILILILGAIVGFVLLATMLPILEAGNVT